MSKENAKTMHNVFEQLGFSQSEAAALKMKAELHAIVVRAASRYSQAELQEILQESQPRVSDLLRGKISKFSLETLVCYAEALGMHPQIKASVPRKPKEVFA
jgi:predicted XRE-type DNA-binding protein